MGRRPNRNGEQETFVKTRWHNKEHPSSTPFRPDVFWKAGDVSRLNPNQVRHPYVPQYPYLPGWA